MKSENHKQLSDYPIVVWLGIISSIIAIFAFLTGYQSISAVVIKATSTPLPSSTPIVAQIVELVSTPSATPSLTPTSKVQPTSSATTLPPTVDPFCHFALLYDETIPDDTIFKPSYKFTKKWGVKNAGYCTWEAGYKWVFVSGDLMNASSTIVFKESVHPGQIIEISVDFIAPSQPGNYKSNWMVETTDGYKFGSGDNRDKPIWVQIIVQN